MRVAYSLDGDDQRELTLRRRRRCGIGLVALFILYCNLDQKGIGNTSVGTWGYA